ncbi:YggS family pyridoxal phosphate-dependent enzyme [Mycolicibacterium aichiense]|uniref:Pyridoxal phosphate homeostasis protein n=2 Tax=Mycolicibacterium TaxID=1866885 RepID=A0AAD1MCG8_9MYCO|nr:YggS family pyridoxal phosphate-dependent enzyme [Mycolicibacterium aichiense]MCV7018963.1 YggS family pyridoxal phosphate-dependent enzyme [Mycolicibacterium aichiense]BBX08493.1 YggS family pyridoxal phosphate enzyme [Mycolicibacterium aichiense]STZ82290.1 alanine racemase domain-containing protein [Mycolicibacterium aichiense]
MTSPTDREAELATALAALTDRLAAAAHAAGRDVAEIELLPITKFFPATDVAILWRLGCRVFGESREQEASAKIAEVADLTGASDLRWHMVGQIQRNKAKAIAAWADTVHSLSTAKVAAALDRGVALAIEEGVRSAPISVFVQISLDGDTSRGGVDIGDPGAVDELCALVAEAGGLRLAGLMAVPPLGADPDAAFAALADEHRRILRNHPGATALSAGMSGDLEAAVRHGSTCVRVGTALMGQRPLTSP